MSGQEAQELLLLSIAPATLMFFTFFGAVFIYNRIKEHFDLRECGVCHISPLTLTAAKDLDVDMEGVCIRCRYLNTSQKD